MEHHNGPILVPIVITIVIVIIVMTIFTRRARRAGYGIGGETIVRCSQGHLFTTIWLPGGSFKAIRLGMLRFQHCPVGHHWSLVAPVKQSELTPEERRLAESRHDSLIP